MKIEIKKKWLEALRSGEYKQGKNQLYNSKNHTFCCLGVLCDIAAKENFGKWDGDYFVYPGASVWGGLSMKLLEWAGIEGECYTVYIPGMGTLAALNDEGKSFVDIANVIEENFNYAN